MRSTLYAYYNCEWFVLYTPRKQSSTCFVERQSIGLILNLFTMAREAIKKLVSNYPRLVAEKERSVKSMMARWLLKVITFFECILILLFTSTTAKKICFEKYGCFANTKYFKTKHAELPSHPHIIQTKFYLHTTFNRQSAELNMNNISSIASSQFNSSHKTFIIIHGYDHHPKKPWVIKMKNELLINYQCNVITVDWKKGASYRKLSYLKAVANGRLVGAQTAHLIGLLRNLAGLTTEQVHIVGHSLGAHVAGYVGKHMNRKKLSLGRITGLDPARPYFEGRHHETRLHKTDASFVDVIHTNAAPFLLGGVGYRGQLGHADFYPNGGEHQPGCGSFFGTIWRKGILYIGMCHHIRSVIYFTESIRQKCLFPAFPCSSWKDFKNRKCSEKFSLQNLSLMGMPAEKYQRHDQPLFLRTMATSPYCAYSYLITVSYSRSKVNFNAVYIQLIGSNGASKKKKIKIRRGTETGLELTTENNDIGKLIRVKMFYYGFSTLFIHNVKVTFLHNKEIYISCFNQQMKNSFWLFWRPLKVHYERVAHVGNECRQTLS